MHGSFSTFVRGERFRGDKKPLAVRSHRVLTVGVVTTLPTAAPGTAEINDNEGVVSLHHNNLEKTRGTVIPFGRGPIGKGVTQLWITRMKDL